MKKKCRVLIVDDIAINRELVIEYLKIIGIKGDTANNGQEAIDKIRRFRYDIVFMDIDMPIMDGLTATREIRKLPGMKNLPIIALTANNQIIEKCIDAGCDEHVLKPVDLVRLKETIEKWSALPLRR